MKTPMSNAELASLLRLWAAKACAYTGDDWNEEHVAFRAAEALEEKTEDSSGQLGVEDHHRVAG